MMWRATINQPTPTVTVTINGVTAADQALPCETMITPLAQGDLVWVTQIVGQYQAWVVVGRRA